MWEEERWEKKVISAHSLQVGSPAWCSRMLRKNPVVQEGDRSRDMCDFSGSASHNPQQPKDTCSHKKEQGARGYNIIKTHPTIKKQMFL